jgi:amidohydrolase
MNPVVQLRHELHQNPELSGCEKETAGRIARFFEPLQPDVTLCGLGGHGIAFVFSGTAPGPTVLLRCELDALPIQEINDFDICSVVDGVSHKCGHDGHMAILASVGCALSRNRPEKGRAVLLYQPAEENGRGAEAVICDPRFEEIKPDYVFALHNLPGFPLGQILVRDGTFSCASRGVVISLRGSIAHAAQPETGHSPTNAMCRTIEMLEQLRSSISIGNELAFATVVGARLGAADSFGTTPGDAEIRATLRSEADHTMNQLVERTEELMMHLASSERLQCDIEYLDDFNATVNTNSAVNAVRRAAGDAKVQAIDKPFRWSEDFGRFTRIAEGALFGIGAGLDLPDLHDPAYDFPDDVIPLGAAVLEELVREYLS